MKNRIILAAAGLLALLSAPAVAQTVGTSATAATKANQVLHNTKLDTIITNTNNLATILARLPQLGTQSIANSMSVTPATSSTWAVTGTFWQATQPASIADGSDIALGAKASTVCATDTGTCDLVALIKRLNQRVTALETLVTSSNTKLDTLHTDMIDTTPVAVNANVATSAYRLAAALGSGDKVLISATDNLIGMSLSASVVRTSTAWVQLFNANAAADVTLGTTVPTLSIPLQGKGTLDTSQQWDINFLFPLGIVIAITTGERNSTGVTAGDVLGLQLTYR